MHSPNRAEDNKENATMIMNTCREYLSSLWFVDNSIVTHRKNAVMPQLNRKGLPNLVRTNASIPDPSKMAKVVNNEVLLCFSFNSFNSWLDKVSHLIMMILLLLMII